MVQTSPSSQVTVLPVQTGAPLGPPTQVSPTVHRLPSSHDPIIGVKTHEPPTQVSAVHGFASSHRTGVLRQAPVAGSHRSVVHGSASAHLGFPWQVGTG